MARTNMGRLLASAAFVVAAAPAGAADYFERIATWPVFLNLPDGVDPASQTVAEIVAATPDGMMLVYTDSPGERIGLVDLADPAAPAPAGTIDVGGEPTSVTVVGDTVLVGRQHLRELHRARRPLAAIDVASRAVTGALRCGRPARFGRRQPRWPLPRGRDRERARRGAQRRRDPAAAGRQARDLRPRRRRPPDQLRRGPPGRPHRPRRDRARGPRARVRRHQQRQRRRGDAAGEQPHRAGRSRDRRGHRPLPRRRVDLAAIDTVEDDGIIAGTGSLAGVLREPDAVAWLDDGALRHRQRGRLRGRLARLHDLLERSGEVLYEFGQPARASRHGARPLPGGSRREQGRRARGRRDRHLRRRPADLRQRRARQLRRRLRATPAPAPTPEFVQLLPTAVGPEGLLAIPERDLFVVSSEVDSRGGRPARHARHLCPQRRRPRPTRR